MREDNLLCLRRRKFVVTTNSNHNRPVYPNLARGMVLTGIDQLWVADITYIRLETEFVYLAVVLDAFSRRVIGWALDRTLEDELTLTALRMALQRRIPAPNMVHHSDRGISVRLPGLHRPAEEPLLCLIYLDTHMRGRVYKRGGICFRNYCGAEPPRDIEVAGLVPTVGW
jgi:transposase InsO family protein